MKISANTGWETYKGRKALVIGIGGGMDIGSATLIGNCLKNRSGFQEVHIGGVLNPGRIHFYRSGCNRPEGPANKITAGTWRASVNRSPFERDTKFIDNELPGILKNEGFSGFHHFSFRFGSKDLIDSFEMLQDRNGFDLVVGVDVGGDMLARGKKDPNIQTPVMDICGLNLLRNIRALGIPASLIVFGIGTDAELTTDGISEIDAELGSSKTVGTFRLDDPEIVKLRSLHERIKNGWKKNWNTVKYFLKTLEFLSRHRQDTFRKYDRPVTLDDGGSIPTWMVLEPQYFGKYWLIDPCQLAISRPSLSADYDNALEQYIKAKLTCPSWKTEPDGLFIWSGDNWRTTLREGTCIQLACFSERICKTQRAKLFRRVLVKLNQGVCDAALIFSDDIKDLPARKRLLTYNIGNVFALISKDPISEDVIGSIRDLVAKLKP